MAQMLTVGAHTTGFVAEEDDGTILGLQVLKVASEGNAYAITVGWGGIGTHVKPDTARRGVGKTLITTMPHPHNA